MPINAHPEYLAAEKEYLNAETPQQKLKALEKMISLSPKHKGAENLRAQLKTRYKKLKEQFAKAKKSGRSSKIGIKKEDMQAIIIGFTNAGKSSLISLLTNAEAEIADYDFTTKKPIIGMMNHEGVQIQIIENPSIESDFFDKGIVHSTDTLLVLISSLEQLKEIEKQLDKSKAKKIIVFNKSDRLNPQEKRKLFATLQSRKYNFVIISTKTKENIEELKEKIFKSFDKIRVYTKEPGKTKKTERPIILNPNSTVKEVAEKILKGFSGKIKETRIWGPSSKFAGQKIGLKHKLKDLDVVEFKTR